MYYIKINLYYCLFILYKSYSYPYMCINVLYNYCNNIDIHAIRLTCPVSILCVYVFVYRTLKYIF